jgi:hypothetical protein
LKVGAHSNLDGPRDLFSAPVNLKAMEGAPMTSAMTLMPVVEGLEPRWMLSAVAPPLNAPAPVVKSSPAAQA